MAHQKVAVVQGSTKADLSVFFKTARVSLSLQISGYEDVILSCLIVPSRLEKLTPK